jgi:hypothetical protein
MCVGAYQSSGGFAPITSAQEKESRWHHFTCGDRLAIYIGAKNKPSAAAGWCLGPTDRQVIIECRLVAQGGQWLPAFFSAARKAFVLRSARSCHGYCDEVSRERVRPKTVRRLGSR